MQEYVDVVILRDVVERRQLSNILPLRVMIRYLLAAPATLFSINKFHNSFKSQGKVYVIDTGLANAFLHQPFCDWGKKLNVKKLVA